VLLRMYISNDAVLMGFDRNDLLGFFHRDPDTVSDLCLGTQTHLITYIASILSYVVAEHELPRRSR
jgi:hypothetical protein